MAAACANPIRAPRERNDSGCARITLECTMATSPPVERIFDSNAMRAAHRQLPMGTKLKVTNLANGKSVVVKGE